MGERSRSCPLGLLGELDAREVEVLLRHAEVGVPGPPHHRWSRVTGRRVVRDRRMRSVME